MKLYNLILFPSVLILLACGDHKHYTGNSKRDNGERSENVQPARAENIPHINTNINTGNTSRQELITYASGLVGIPYKYGSIDPEHGFDCSGFITYVFNHFGISVPRSSIDFTNVNEQIDLRNSRAGDLILFTGTDSTIREVGHMGIITANNGQDINFIHSTSGKAYAVTVTPLNKYYQGRFVKAIRIFND
jgi:cell wall-associated NlpC family hydrolase